MKRMVSVLLIMLLALPCYAISDWKQGTNTAPIEGTSNPSDIDTNLSNNCVDPLDKLLSDYIYGCSLTRTSATVVTVGIGDVTCKNGADTIKRMRKNTATTTVDMAVTGVGGIDSGSGAEATSTWYSVYAVADADATTFTAICGKQGTALSDVTYYRYVGSFYNNSAGNIDNFYWYGNGADVTVMHDIPVLITTTNSAAWSGATSCSTGMPSTAKFGVFGLYSIYTNNTNYIGVRPNGGTWSSSSDNLITGTAGSYGVGIGGQRLSAVDSTQQINYITQTSGSCRLSVEGYKFSR